MFIDLAIAATEYPDIGDRWDHRISQVHTHAARSPPNTMRDLACIFNPVFHDLIRDRP